MFMAFLPLRVGLNRTLLTSGTGCPGIPDARAAQRTRSHWALSLCSFDPHLCVPRCNRQMLLASCQYLYLLRHQRHGGIAAHCTSNHEASMAGPTAATAPPHVQNHQMPQPRNGASNAAPFTSPPSILFSSPSDGRRCALGSGATRLGLASSHTIRE